MNYNIHGDQNLVSFESINKEQNQYKYYQRGIEHNQSITMTYKHPCLKRKLNCNPEVNKKINGRRIRCIKKTCKSLNCKI